MISWFEKHNRFSWTITILIAIIIFYLSTLAFYITGTGKIFPWKATVYHFGVFFIFGFFLLISLVKGKYPTFISIAIIFAILYGISDEIHQLFVKGRQFDTSDILTNSAGILLSGFLYSLSLVYRNNHKNKNY